MPFTFYCWNKTFDVMDFFISNYKNHVKEACYLDLPDYKQVFKCFLVIVCNIFEDNISKTKIILFIFG